ncbi:MAG: hypothetical protein H7124_10525 [Phycisphaerales bacterium]|nr:hypothetical protein [Hyphomonadaceae bacterium]
MHAGFWIGIAITVAVVIGASVLVGMILSRPRGEPLSHHDKVNALKASGALKHRKSGR